MVPAISEKILHICNKIDIHRPPYDAMQDRTAAALRRMQRTAGQSEQEMPGHASGTTSPNDTGCRGHPENASPPQGRKRQMPQLSATAFTPCYYPISVHPAKKRKGRAFEALPFHTEYFRIVLQLLGMKIERTLERTGHLVAGIARKVERQRVGLPAAGHGHRTFLDAGIARYGIILHPNIPRTVRKLRMGITERTAADLTDFRRYRSAVEVGDYRIGSVRQIIFVVIVLSQYLAGNLQAHLIAGACKHIYPVV